MLDKMLHHRAVSGGRSLLSLANYRQESAQDENAIKLILLDTKVITTPVFRRCITSPPPSLGYNLISWDKSNCADKIGFVQ